MRQVRFYSLRIVGIITVFALALAASAAPLQKGILWKIDSAGHRASYLLGTMHSEDPRVTQIPAKVRTPFELASSFTAEIKMDIGTMISMSQSMFYLDGRELESIIGKQQYQKSVSLLANYGIPAMLVKHMKPWAVATTLSLPKPKTGLFLDLMLFNEAQAQGKALYGLETPAEQLAIFDNMSDKEQVTMLQDTLKNHHLLPGMLDQLLGAYLQRDLTKLQKLSDEFMKMGDAKIAKKFTKEIVIDRNHRMVKRMQPRLKEGNAFIAVGALHLPGDEGILNLLKKRGYRVSPVY